jgi:hypothetical protein
MKSFMPLMDLMLVYFLSLFSLAQILVNAYEDNVGSDNQSITITPAHLPTSYLSTVNSIDYESGLCRHYTVNELNGGRSYVTCSFNACPGSTIVASNIYNTSHPTNTFLDLALYDNSQNLLARAKSAMAACTDNVVIVYRFNDTSCKTLTLRQGCKKSPFCHGQIYVTGITDPRSTLSQSSAVVKIDSHNFDYKTGACQAYYGYDTHDAETKYNVCSFFACPGSVTISIGSDSKYSRGPGYIELYDQYRNIVGKSSPDNELIRYVLPGSSCQMMHIHQGCRDVCACYGTVHVEGFTYPDNEIIISTLTEIKINSHYEVFLIGILFGVACCSIILWIYNKVNARNSANTRQSVVASVREQSNFRGHSTRNLQHRFSKSMSVAEMSGGNFSYQLLPNEILDSGKRASDVNTNDTGVDLKVTAQSNLYDNEHIKLV